MANAIVKKITLGSTTYDIKDNSGTKSTHTHTKDQITDFPVIPDISGKLDKLTYEWNKSISFGSSGYLLIGKFPCYDTNITIDIDSTTSTTYHATLVIATQNINTSRGGTYVCNVYDDANNTVTGSFKIQYSSGSRNFNVYFAPQSWSKNLVHIRAVGLQSAPTESEICTNVNSIPSSDLLNVTNLLSTTFATATHIHQDYEDRITALEEALDGLLARLTAI